MRTGQLAAGTLLMVLLVACGGDDQVSSVQGGTGVTESAPQPGSTTTEEQYPPAGSAAGSISTSNGCAHVIDGTVELLSDGSYRVAATVASADTGWDKYADAWEIRTPDGAILGIRVLAHPHETEQPFTRSLAPVEIPAEVIEVVLSAQDSVAGFCGESFTIAVQR